MLVWCCDALEKGNKQDKLYSYSRFLSGCVLEIMVPREARSFLEKEKQIKPKISRSRETKEWSSIKWKISNRENHWHQKMVISKVQQNWQIIIWPKSRIKEEGHKWSISWKKKTSLQILQTLREKIWQQYYTNTFNSLDEMDTNYNWLN